ncbi:MAG: hypothetical protein R2761_16325 [Acidimicrobiales bacterium]
MAAETKNEQVMVRMRGDQVEQLRRLASEDDRSIAYVVRKAVDLYLSQQR